MIIPNPLVKLDYNPGDILTVEWPNFNDYSVSEAIHILNIVIEAVRYHDIKYLLTDTRNRMVDIPDAQYKETVMKFAEDLRTTRLQRLARVVTANTVREKPINEIREKARLTIPFKMEEALEWLVSE
ncbi:hypothetical protein POKO110462_09460 [Pontibacter korlensis]|uniref:STAS/SEC14 domain-containing protein n=1 Tax=Pontibacter korlensis TaxID=400092 RepID=A0A0E3UW33_9BACT|nr:hypothetical protein [Pontibacter korlensis]AKD03022.1 hypothetical protein PKOR_07675 [Pontibacter korlensis]